MEKYKVICDVHCHGGNSQKSIEYLFLFQEADKGEKGVSLVVQKGDVCYREIKNVYLPSCCLISYKAGELYQIEKLVVEVDEQGNCQMDLAKELLQRGWAFSEGDERECYMNDLGRAEYNERLYLWVHRNGFVRVTMKRPELGGRCDNIRVYFAPNTKKIINRCIDILAGGFYELIGDKYEEYCKQLLEEADVPMDKEAVLEFYHQLTSMCDNIIIWDHKEDTRIQVIESWGEFAEMSCMDADSRSVVLEISGKSHGVWSNEDNNKAVWLGWFVHGSNEQLCSFIRKGILLGRIS